MIDVGGKKLFACDECPITEQLEYGEFQSEHCGCDKVKDEFFACGYCEDAWVDRPAEPKGGKRKLDGRTVARCGLKSATGRLLSYTAEIQCLS